MPVKPKRKLQERKAIEPWLIYFLVHGEMPAETDGINKIDAFVLEYERERREQIWKEVKDKILKDFVKNHPCQRPWAWWEFDAPRWNQKFDAWFDGTLPEPRQRLGGIGDPDFEHLAYVPRFSFGLPLSFVDQWDVDYYNGRALDVHGEPIGSEYKEGDFEGKAIDPEDPPIFECQAAYLQRHDLLTLAEKRLLQKHPELLDPERIEFQDGESNG